MLCIPDARRGRASWSNCELAGLRAGRCLRTGSIALSDADGDVVSQRISIALSEPDQGPRARTRPAPTM